MNRTLWTTFAAATAFASLTMAVPAQASSVVTGSCDPVTNGDAAGCLFSGNINGNADPTNDNGFKNAENAYNVWALANANPTITLNFITKSDDGDFGTFGSITGDGTSSGTFNLPGWNIEYFAVKSARVFVLYEFIGSSGSWSVASGKDLSHLAFFGSRTTTPAVPEPGTWAMMLIGFGAAGAAMRRRKHRGGAILQVA